MKMPGIKQDPPKKQFMRQGPKWREIKPDLDKINGAVILLWQFLSFICSKFFIIAASYSLHQLSLIFPLVCLVSVFAATFLFAVCFHICSHFS